MNKVIKKGKVANIFVLERVIVGLIASGMFCLLLYLILSTSLSSSAIIFIGLVVVVLETLEGIISTKCIKIELTEDRIMGKKGFFKTTELDSPIDKITQIKVEQNLLGKIFDYGDIVITTASATFDFKHIKDANGFRDAVNKQIEKN